jgi:Glycosyltransferase family 87
VSTAIPRRAIHLVGLKRTLGRVSTWLLLGALPVLIVFAPLAVGFHNGTGAWALDFNGNFVTPARDILRGVSPYHTAYLEHVRAAVADGRRPDQFSKGVFATYPAPALLIGVPFTYLPAALAEWLWLGAMVACAAVALRLAGARDWRVYGASLLTPAMGTSLAYGTVNCALMLGLAATWRWRDRAGRAGAALAALIALKLIFLPLLAWLVCTRRFAAAAVACAGAAALWLGGWALIGFHGLGDYPHVLSLLSDIERRQGFSTVSNALALGLGGRAASIVPYVLGAGVITLLWLAIRRGGPRADAHGFLLAMLAMLVLSPIVWLHYLVFLLVPLAVLRPRFGVAWLMPSLLWALPFAGYTPANPLQRIAVIAAILGTVALAIGPRSLLPAFSGRPPSRGGGTIPEWR